MNLRQLMPYQRNCPTPITPWVPVVNVRNEGTKKVDIFLPHVMAEARIKAHDFQRR